MLPRHQSFSWNLKLGNSQSRHNT